MRVGGDTPTPSPCLYGGTTWLNESMDGRAN